MKVGTFDIEADGFQEDATQMHCLVTKDFHTRDVFRGYDNKVITEITPLDTSNREAVDHLCSYDIVIGHNIIGYDFDILDKFYGKHPASTVIDTLVWSQVLNPDRQLPRGCPTSYRNPLTGKLDRVTPHSLAAWGYRVARAKPQHFDWMTLTQEMLHRCVEDVEITELTFLALCQEAEMLPEEAFKEMTKDNNPPTTNKD